MVSYSPDIIFAYAQLGLEAGASSEEIRQVLENAAAYRFATGDRVERVQRLVNFFHSRRNFGDVTQTFADIKKLYHRKAMDLHPDRNKGSNATEERLKKINAAYSLVDEIYREAKEYYKQSEADRRAAEQEARQTRLRESQKGENRAEAAPEQKPSQPPPQAAGARKYMAASIPRNIRTSRLSHLPLQTVIGSKVTKKENDLNHVFDIIMLPELHFMRAKAYMASPEGLGTQLTYGKFSPSYTPRDTKELIVPADEPNPEKFARDYFRKEFGLTSAS